MATILKCYELHWWRFEVSKCVQIRSWDI